MACKREILNLAADFKGFWNDQGPFKYAVTCHEFPPILLAPEEWIFGNDLEDVLSELMGFKQEKMAFVKAPFNPANKAVLRPDNLSVWKIKNFPEAWNHMACDLFVPEGHLTLAVEAALGEEAEQADAAAVKTVFFRLLADSLGDMGYTLLKPRENSKWASVHAYLKEWETDDADAGLAG